ncbi:MAG: asparagine synthase (glutamine-hydrolyzing) [Beijerinckiaceae bacterium]
MCGLTAIVQRRGSIARDRLASSLMQLAHRGPDASAMLIETLRLPSGESLAEIGLGHARLAIIDRDARSNQPMALEDDRLVYNGEIYNFRALARGMALNTTGDSEVLLRLLQHGRIDALNDANGMWAFCWLDGRNATLHAARDRYGKKPLFYTMDDESICFASEPSALLTLAGHKPVLRADAMDAFLADGWLFPDPSGQTHLEDVREVRPGHCLTLDIANWTVTERLVTAVEHLPEREAATPRSTMVQPSLPDLLADAVEARLVSDRKVGRFLSGGVDSSLILSVLSARGLADQVICVTGDAGKSADSAYAQACIKQLGIDCLSIPLDYGATSFAQFLGVCKAQGKPFPLIGNVLGMHALYQAVSQHDIRVVLDGTGADEIFGGYWYRYFGFAERDARQQGNQEWLSRIAPPAASAQREFPRREGLTEADCQWLDDISARRITTRAPRDPLIGFNGSFNDALRLDATAGRMQEWLWQNDRNAMAWGIENRSPFLDFRLSQYLSTPYSEKFEGPFNKSELRPLFDVFAPLPTAQRIDKQGFRWNYKSFMANNRASMIEILGDSKAVAQLAKADALITSLKEDDTLFDSRLFHRMLVLAGLEAVNAFGI